MTSLQFSLLAFKLAKRIRHYGEVISPQFWFSYPALSISTLGDPIFTTDQIRNKLNPIDSKTIVSNANSICKNEFNLLGGSLSCPNENIDWHTDFINNFTWPSDILYSKVRSHSIKGADIKVPWELSRFNFVISISLAYLVNGDKKYVNKFIALSTNWMNSNPVGYGVNWACTMDVAIRAINWTTALALLYEPLSTDVYCEFLKKIRNSLWSHANFIRTHLEWNGPKANSGANHLLFNLVGLYTLGVFFKNSTKGKKWLKYAQSNLEFQMDRQVLDDGVHFECSIGYHRLCLEAFLWCKHLAKNIEQPFSSAYYNRLEKMQAFVSDYIKPTGLAPLVGDNDDGRLFDTGLLPLSNHKYLLPDSEDGTFYLDRFLLDGTLSVGPQTPNQGVSEYNSSGFYFFTSLDTKLLVRAGNLAYDGTHAHNDQLSFELTINHTDIFVDRGTFQYSANPAQRNLFRSTEAHNTMRINNQEQNKLSPAIFTLAEETNTIITETGRFCIRAVHNGFKSTTTSNYQHERFFKLGTKELVIEDTISGLVSGDVLHWFFHLAPGLLANITEQGINIFKENNRICNLKLKFDANSSIDFFKHSPSFGVVIDASRVHISKSVYETYRDPVPYLFNILWE